jgi:hypothetical protein
MSVDRSYRIQQQFKTSTLDIFRTAIRLRQTHDIILKNISDRIYGDPLWAKVPDRVRAYIRGIMDARFDDMWSRLVWLKSIDGKLLTTKEVDALTAKEAKLKKSKANNYRSPWGRCDGQTSAYVWKDEAGNPLRDKPYLVKPI